MKIKPFLTAMIPVICLIVVSNLQAQIKQAVLKTSAVHEFEKAEWDIQLIEKWQNPYLSEEISLDMHVKAPSGKNLAVPCFYVSGKSGMISRWQARFTPQETGKYICNFSLLKEGILVSELQSNSFVAEPSEKSGFLHLNNNYTFIFDNGAPFRGLGENICWESRSMDDSKYYKTLHENSRFNYEYMLRKLSSNGGNYTRIWICPWNFPLEWQVVSPDTRRYSNSTEYYNPGAIAKLDRLFELADSLKVYIMLTLSGGGGFETSNYSAKTIGYAVSDSDFFVNSKSKQQYKNKLRYLIARWGYSPSIAAWEFFNEVDYQSFSKDTGIHKRQKEVTDWHSEMSSYFRVNDPYRHLITTSISHRDVEGLNSVKNIDFNQKHIYKNTFSIPSTIINYTAKFNKPYVIGEFGFEWDWNKNFDLFAEDMDSDFKRGLWLGLFSPTPILPMSWWWEFFESRGMMSYFLKVRAISDEMIKAGHGNFEPIKAKFSESAIKIFALKCEKTIFIYLFNPGKLPAKGTVEVQDYLARRIQSYNCETGQYSDLGQSVTAGSKMNIPEIELPGQSDMILLIDLKK